MSSCWASAKHLWLRLQGNAERTAETWQGHLDGSAAAVQILGALISAGSISRHWGPGWSGSLILGDSARPVTGLSIRRADPTRPFATPWLNWLGPWDAEVLFGQLQGHNEPRSPRLLAMRLETAPTRWLAVGASRAIQWGGEGRNNSIRTLWKAFLGRDNAGADGIDSANEPGNQLGGFDARLSLAALGVPAAVYTQWIGEDEAGYLPSKYISQSGLEVWSDRRALRWRLVIERADTRAGQDGLLPGTTYRHHIYRDGYTQRGRSLGFPLGADVRATIGHLYVFGAGAWSGAIQALNGRANEGAVAGLAFAPRSGLGAVEVRLSYEVDRAGSVEVRIGRTRYTPYGGVARETTVGGIDVRLRLR
ncbi:MAG: capsule assembly Wzi family protein [Burkholderiaceae bacterium]|nr:capsule assembly Wzi family protein [Burkholderiaceae bacterium]